MFWTQTLYLSYVILISSTYYPRLQIMATKEPLCCAWGFYIGQEEKNGTVAILFIGHSWHSYIGRFSSWMWIESLLVLIHYENLLFSTLCNLAGRGLCLPSNFFGYLKMSFPEITYCCQGQKLLIMNIISMTCLCAVGLLLSVKHGLVYFAFISYFALVFGDFFKNMVWISLMHLIEI